MSRGSVRAAVSKASRASKVAIVRGLFMLTNTIQTKSFGQLKDSTLKVSYHEVVRKSCGPRRPPERPPERRDLQSKIFISGLNPDTLPQTLGEYCQGVGEVRYATVYMDAAAWPFLRKA